MAGAKCENCGSALEAPLAGQDFLQCHYCGHRSQLQQPRVITQERIVVVHERRVPPVVVAPSPTKYLWVYLMIPLIAVVGPIIATVASRSASGTTAGGLASALTDEHLQWGNEAPFAAKINADATEDFVGRYHVLGGSGDKTLEYVGGYDGATLKRVWQAGPYGDQGDTRGLHMAVVGNSVLVTDQRSVGHILDAATGKETASITLSDRADSICVEPSGKPEAWIKVSDNQDLDVDFTTKRSKKSPRPPWCKEPDVFACSSGRFEKTNAECAKPDAAFSAPSFSAKKQLTEGAVTVVVGEKSPGTAMPTAVGWDPKAKRILWQRPIPQSESTRVSDGLGLVDLGGGRLVSQIELTTGIYKLIALDGKTGAQLWDTEIPNSKDGSEADQMLVTATRVYLPHWTWLNVFDAKTGAVIGTVGVW